ncbi:Small integral membrane protein [Citrobacter koseri]|nr:hypothetical protein AN2351V1_3665 [Citrobacter koseri]CAH6155657.1 hypothetical protein AN2351V1_3665 [Citrobacter koseri]SQB43852.1 Small integral membrane protein [Citrobacter koseri]SUX87497.1 Small integral membrane protein [Citrobacter koseri]
MYTTLKISRMSNLNAHIKRSTLTMVKERLMFRWGIIFLVIALIAAALGFGGLAGTAASAAKIVFVVGIVLFLISLFMGRKRP